VIVYGVIKNSLDVFLSVILTLDKDNKESIRTLVIKMRGYFYGHRNIATCFASLECECFRR
jgi:hypothetical protein